MWRRQSALVVADKTAEWQTTCSKRRGAKRRGGQRFSEGEGRGGPSDLQVETRGVRERLTEV